ncbi:hypothetical protein HUU05_17340 [candidate division KSB1 bacterium]|nr:hypothetical protein [candidate division KSB1 bacterium]
MMIEEGKRPLNNNLALARRYLAALEQRVDRDTLAAFSARLPNPTAILKIQVQRRNGLLGFKSPRAKR